MKPPRVFLIGPMGAGKSTIGRQLANIMGLQFFDTDSQIESRCGADIPWIFDVEGESGFRARETQVLSDLCSEVQSVIATGGGIVKVEENRKLIKKSGFVVYLHASEKQQLERTSRDKKRPLLQVDNPKAVIADLMAEREPLYRELADLVMQTDQRSARKAATEIASAIEKTDFL